MPVEQRSHDTTNALPYLFSPSLLPDGDHFIADEVYSNPKLQQWLVSQSRSKTSVAV